MMNVMGTADLNRDGEIISYWIVITSFAAFPDGSKGALLLALVGGLFPLIYVYTA
jgi:hypothetical protein